jgi:hypothetical protein
VPPHRVLHLRLLRQAIQIRARASSRQRPWWFAEEQWTRSQRGTSCSDCGTRSSLLPPSISLSLLVWRRSSSTIAASPRRLVAIARCSATRRSGGAQSVDRGGEARIGWQRCSLEDACVSNGDRHDAAAESVQGWAGGGCDCLFGEWTKLLYFSVASSDEP